MSTPFSPFLPRISVIIPSALLPFNGHLMISVTTTSPSSAKLLFLLFIYMSFVTLISSGTRKPKFLDFWQTPTNLLVFLFITFSILPSALLSSISFFTTLTSTVSPFIASFIDTSGIKISDWSSPLETNPKPLLFTSSSPITTPCLSGITSWPLFSFIILPSSKSLFTLLINWYLSFLFSLIILIRLFKSFGLYLSF